MSGATQVHYPPGYRAVVGTGAQPTWEEHGGEGVRSPQVVDEDALEGLAAGRLLVPRRAQTVRPSRPTCSLIPTLGFPNPG